MKQYYIDLTAGVFVIAGALSLAFLSVRLGGVGFPGGGYKLSARFSQVAGLRKDAPVVIAGVDVGEVTDISLTNFAADVEFRIREDIKLPEDSIASIKTRGLIGEQFIELSPGAARETIQPGGRIRETESAIDLHSLIAKYAFGEVE